MFVLSSGFYVVNLVAWPLLRHTGTLLDAMLETGSLDHLAATVAFGGVYVLMRTQRLSLSALRVVDVTALLLGCTLFALMGADLPALQAAAEMDAATGAYAGLLACANTVMARAIAVPSTPRRSFIVSTVAMLPLIPATVFAGHGGQGL